MMNELFSASKAKMIAQEKQNKQYADFLAQEKVQNAINRIMKDIEEQAKNGCFHISYPEPQALDFLAGLRFDFLEIFFKDIGYDADFQDGYHFSMFRISWDKAVLNDYSKDNFLLNTKYSNLINKYLER